MKSDNWEVNRRIENRFHRDILGFMKELFPQIVSGKRVTMISQSEFARRYAEQAATRMITGLLVQSAKTWRMAAQQSLRAQEIYQALQHEMHGTVGMRVRQLIDDNASLISSLPETISNRVAHYVQQQTVKGKRADEIAKELRVMAPRLAITRINLIARTETSKASTALTRARSEELDLNWLVWRTSKDSRVRPSHRLLDGVLVDWNDLPSPEALLHERSTLGHYAPGDAPNCRCYPEPMLRLDQVKWPHRIYRDGRIHTITRAGFARIAGVEVRIAA